MADLTLLNVPQIPTRMQHAYYRVYVYLRPEALATGWDRQRMVDEIVTEGVPCFSGICSEI